MLSALPRTLIGSAHPDGPSVVLIGSIVIGAPDSVTCPPTQLIIDTVPNTSFATLIEVNRILSCEVSGRGGVGAMFNAVCYVPYVNNVQV